MNFIGEDDQDLFDLFQMKLIFNLFSINIDLINNLNH